MSFWERKMKTYFTRIDFDKDGAITNKDFEAMADRFVSFEKLDAAKGAVLKGKLTTIWDKYLKNVASGNSLTLPVFLEAVKKQKNEHHLAETFGGPLPLFFHAVDANNDAQIQEDEFVLFFQIIGLNPEHAPASFKAIDTNNDGQISLNEFVAAGTEFFTSEDESLPSKLFWGPLV